MKKAKKHAKKARKAWEMCRACQADPEVAHGYQDEAYEQALKAIAKGYEPAAELAKRVLELSKLDCQKWCAGRKRRRL